jgi:hypothetical protein
MLDRNKRIKPRPERFQNCKDLFDLILTCEERVYDQVVEGESCQWVLGVTVEGGESTSFGQTWSVETSRPGAGKSRQRTWEWAGQMSEAFLLVSSPDRTTFVPFPVSWSSWCAVHMNRACRKCY